MKDDPLLWAIGLPLIVMFCVFCVKYIYRGMVHFSYWLLLRQENKRREELERRKLEYKLEFYGDKEKEEDV